MGRIMRIVLASILCSIVIAVPSIWAYWIHDGVPLCTAARNQEYPTIVSDGVGGAIVTWHDERSGDYDIYVQRVSALGIAQWAAQGVALCTATGSQRYPTITSDGVGGAIVTWEDYRNGTWDIYAQRVDASGAVQWTADGVALCTATGYQYTPTITADGAGGAIVTWWDERGDNIYAQRIDASGAVQWTADGVLICGAVYGQYYPTITSDGVGGAIVTWYDFRQSGNYNVFAQRVDASGTVQWTADGVVLCGATGTQEYPMITSDGMGGVIVTWRDDRSGNSDIYVQRMDASGAVQWTTNGVALCIATGSQQYPSIISDDAGGAIVTWQDVRSGNNDIYAQGVNGSGAIQWTADGVALCTATGDQLYPKITSDGAGGAIVTWYDSRSGNNDIYAQPIDRNALVGLLAPEILLVRDVPGDQGGKVYLSWYAAHCDILMDAEMSHYSLWRAISPTRAALAIERGAPSLEDLSELNAPSAKPVVRIEQAGALTYFWELVETVDALYMEAYGKPVATLFDSTAVCTEYHYFQVVAHTTDPKIFWKSEPDSGYSVDNLAPCSPLCLSGEQSYEPEGLTLTWDRNRESDLKCYALYRGITEDFIPAAGNLIASPCDTVYFDGEWRWDSGYHYKVAALDVHGNESGFALLRPEDVTGTNTPKAPKAAYLKQNYPNPFNPMTKIEYGLEASSHISLRIYDAAGRLVRVLVDEACPAAQYEEMWDGRDEAGRQVASGVYFYRLDAASFTETRKMVLLR